MPTRVSSSQIADSSLYGINTALARFESAQRKINTGKQLQVPSDDPSGTAQTLSFRSRLSELEQFGRTIDQAKGFIATSDAALDSVNSLLRQARTLAVQGASGQLSVETREALASQVQNIINQIASVGNSSYGSRYVFTGQRTDLPPIIGSGSSFIYRGGTTATGDGDIFLDVGRGEPLKINATGDTALLPSIRVLESLRDNLSNSNIQQISQTDLANLDVQINNVLGVRADLGAKIQRLDLTKQRNEITKVNFTKFVSDIEDTDVTKAVVEFQSSQTAYEAALQSTARVFSISLLQFLRN